MRLAVVAAFVVVACGGGNQKVDTTGGGGDEEVEEGPDNSGADDNMVSQETLDGIKRVFERKTSIIGRCFADAMEAGELTKRDKVIITVSATITPAGKASSVEITKSDTSSETMKSCVVEKVGSWEFPAPPNDMPFSHVYKFEEF